MLLTDNQSEQVQNRILESGLQNYQLQIDLIDHIACTIEEQIEDGKSFDNAVEFTFTRGSGTHDYRTITPVDLFFILLLLFKNKDDRINK